MQTKREVFRSLLEKCHSASDSVFEKDSYSSWVLLYDGAEMDLEDRTEVNVARKMTGVGSVDAVEKPKGEGAGKYTLLLAFFGEPPVKLVADVAALYAKVYPGCRALDGGHPMSRRLGATLCLVRGDVKGEV